MSLRCKVESKWHVQVRSFTLGTTFEKQVFRISDPFNRLAILQIDGLKVTQILELGTAGLVALCSYIGSNGSGVSAGVLVVDQRQGNVIENIPLSSSSGGQKDVVASIMVDTVEEDVKFRVTCIMSKGQLWRFSLQLDAHGMLAETKGITCLGNIIKSAVDQEAHFESLLSQAVVVPKAQSVSEQRQSEESVPVVDDDQPTFIPENGYRGVKDGYIFWKSEDGKQGYYRVDVMQGILESQRKEQSLDGGEASKEQSSLVDDLQTKKIVRCFLKLDKSSKFVMSSCGAEDGLLYVGTWTEDSEERVRITCDSALIGHLSGVLTLTASPDEQLIASGSYDQTIRIWDTSSWKCLRVLKGHGGGIKALAFTKDGSTLLSTASDNTTRVRQIFILGDP